VGVLIKGDWDNKNLYKGVRYLLFGTWKARYERFGIDGLIKQRKKRTNRPHNKTSEAVEQLVINTTDTYWQDGVEALSDHLQRLYNLTINSTTVYRILKREGISYGEHHPRTTKHWKKQLYVQTKYALTSVFCIRGERGNFSRYTSSIPIG